MDYSLEKYIGKRDKFLISNSYILILPKNKKDEFHIVIYFLAENKIEIVVRKLNNEHGWDYDLKVRIDDKIISIGSSENNFKIIDYYTDFKVNFLEHKSLNFIPKQIMQTNDLIVRNFNHYNTILSILEKNPDYAYIYYNDLDCRNFIIENFKESLTNYSQDENEVVDVLKAYDLLKYGALRADLFRYCYLFVNGGIYIDSKITCKTSLDIIIDENDKFIICDDDAENSYYNGIIITEKNNYNILQMLKEAIQNILHQKYLNDIHEPTGNKLYFKYFKNDKPKLTKNKNLVFYNRNLVFKCDYVDYYSKNYHDFRIGYRDKDYYYYYNYYLDKLIFKFSRDILTNIFSVYHLKENIYCLKNNNNIGWTEPFNLVVYDINSAESKNILIEASLESESVFSF